jgi:hypothetical protein
MICAGINIRQATTIVLFTVLLFDHLLTFGSEVGVSQTWLVSSSPLTINIDVTIQIEYIWRRKMSACEFYMKCQAHLMLNYYNSQLSLPVESICCFGSNVSISLPAFPNNSCQTK